jgi:hypothetical protein
MLFFDRFRYSFNIGEGRVGLSMIYGVSLRLTVYIFVHNIRNIHHLNATIFHPPPF